MLDNQAREVLPSEFLPAAERTDLMRSIDRWVLTAALALIAKRQPDMLFVRLSRDSMLDAGFMEWLDGQLKATLAEPQRLCLQLSEKWPRAICSRPANCWRAEQAAHQGGPGGLWHRSGFHRSARRAARGFSQDRRLADAGPVRHPETQKRVRSIVELASKRAIQTIDERIEDANTMAVVWQLGCAVHPRLPRARLRRGRAQIVSPRRTARLSTRTWSAAAGVMLLALVACGAHEPGTGGRAKPPRVGHALAAEQVLTRAVDAGSMRQSRPLTSHRSAGLHTYWTMCSRADPP